MASEGKIDENLYSRQIGVFGMETMSKLTQLRVLIVGMRGVGVETAKNLILAGPKHVTIQDDAICEPADMGRNYFVSEKDIGKRSRAAASLSHLAKLNPYVKIGVHEGPVTESVVAEHDVAVFTASPLADLVRFNEFCRAQSPPITFLAGDVVGACGYAFSDFGPTFSVHDPRGARADQGIVGGVTRENGAWVVMTGKSQTPLQPGDFVKFSGVQGMVELNAEGPFEVTATGAGSFRIRADTTAFAEYAGGGRFEQVFVPTERHHASLRQRIVCPGSPGFWLPFDQCYMGTDRQALLHAALQGIYAFRAAHGALPTPHDDAQAEEVVRLAREFLAGNAAAAASPDVPEGEEPLRYELGEGDEAIVRALARVAAAEFAPLAAFYGGVLAQEVVKHTGKYTPIDQWLYLDALDALPAGVKRLADRGAATAEVPEVSAEDLRPRGDRYDDAVVLLGASTLERVRGAKVFMVGAGALGCELLKNYALLGIGCGDAGGRVAVTDMDNIELSNLNRQFLFRQENVGQPKSTAAAAAASLMNPGLTVEAMQTAVCEDTEDVFTADFWRAQDIVVGAVDNVKARMYVDSCCVVHERPFVDSGTLGTNAHVQVVLPHRTVTYSDVRDPPEPSIPLCTIKNFPHLVEHCVEWTREHFSSLFDIPARDARLFARDRAEFAGTLESDNAHSQRLRLERLVQFAQIKRDGSLRACARAARIMFEDLFTNTPKQLLFSFPLDYVDGKGNRFWTGTKTPPEPQAFDLGNPDHALFLNTCAGLIAASVGIEGFRLDAEPDLAQLRALLEGVEIPAFSPDRGMRIKASDNDNVEEGSAEDEHVVRKLMHDLEALGKDVNLADLASIEFEKDDDSNGHVDFMKAASNIRAVSYNIQPAPRHEVKRIAGRIIPAIATTTCSVTGLVVLEILKALQRKPLASHRDANMSLAVNQHVLFEPDEPKRTKSVEMDPIQGCPVRAVPEGFTVWDKIEVHLPDATVAELCAHIEATVPSAAVDMIAFGRYSVFAPMMFRSHNDRKDRKIRELIPEITKEPFKPTTQFIILEVGLEDDDGSVVIPPVLFFLQ